jgi:hypothetical protein
MFETMKKWFGFSGNRDAAEAIKNKIKSEINIMDAVAAHIKWKVRLEDYINGSSTETLDPMVICRDDQCALGKWIHGTAANYFNHSDDFQRLRADHAQFHFIAGNVVSKVQTHDQTGAEALMQGEYAHVSRKVVQALVDLNKQVKQ